MGVLSQILLMVFVWTTIISIALSVSPNELLIIFKKPLLLFKSLVMSLFLGPLIVVVLNSIIPIPEKLYIALILYLVIAGAPIGPKFVQIANGDEKYSVLLLAMLNISVILFGAFAIGIFMPGDIVLDNVAIVKILMLLIVLPMIIGMFIKFKNSELAQKMKPVVTKISNIFLLLMIVFFTVNKNTGDMSLELTEYLIIIFVITITFILNYILTLDSKEMNATVALTTLPKNFGPVLAIANTSFVEVGITQYILVMVMVSMIIGMVSSKIICKKMHNTNLVVE
ncbi:MAG: bile acid:sodium symporter [Peptostreptococcaceae bacterium]